MDWVKIYTLIVICACVLLSGYIWGTNGIKTAIGSLILLVGTLAPIFGRVFNFW